MQWFITSMAITCFSSCSSSHLICFSSEFTSSSLNLFYSKLNVINSNPFGNLPPNQKRLIFLFPANGEIEFLSFQDSRPKELRDLRTRYSFLIVARMPLLRIEHVLIRWFYSCSSFWDLKIKIPSLFGSQESMRKWEKNKLWENFLRTKFGWQTDESKCKFYWNCCLAAEKIERIMLCNRSDDSH